MVGAITGAGGVYRSAYLYQMMMSPRVRQFAGMGSAAVKHTSASAQAGGGLRVAAARRAQPDVPVQPAEAVKPVRDNTFNKDALLHYMANDPVEGAVRSRIRYLGNDAQSGTEAWNRPPAPSAREEDTPELPPLPGAGREETVPGLPAQEKAGELLPGEPEDAKEARSGEDGPKIGETPSAQEVAEEGECQTCKKRKYQDGSDDPGVSFKTATRVDPKMAQAAIRGHENEHVVRERAKAMQEDRKVLSQSVSYHNAICPECGKVYLAGGTTRTVTVNQPEPFTPQDEAEEEQKPFSLLA